MKAIRRSARLKALGNAVVPQVAEIIGRVVRKLMEDPSRLKPRGNVIVSLEDLFGFSSD